MRYFILSFVITLSGCHHYITDKQIQKGYDLCKHFGGVSYFGAAGISYEVDIAICKNKQVMNLGNE